MTSAIAEIARKSGRSRDLEPAATGIDIGTFLLDVIRSKKLDIDIGASVTSGSITRTMSGASTISVTISDHRRVLLQSDIWQRTLDINLDGHFFRLVNVSKQGNDLTLTFEDRVVALLRDKSGHVKISRNKMTRAEFVRMLSRKVKTTNIRFYSPSLHKKQQIKSVKKEKDREQNREPGLRKAVRIRITKDTPVETEHSIIQGTPRVDQIGAPIRAYIDVTSGGKIIGPYATKKQLDVAEKILDTGYNKGANVKCLRTGMMVAIQESRLDPRATNGVHVGVFQQDPRYWPATRDVVTDSDAFFDALIKADKEQPNLSYGELANKVQNAGPSYPAEVMQWKKTAKQFVEEYGAQGGDTQREVRKAYQFTVGPPDGPKNENYWDAMVRLADQVRWRIFVIGNTLYYVSDDDLMKSKPRMTLTENEDGVDSIDFDWDVHKRNNECTVSCRAGRWVAPPGSVVVVDDSGPASLDGGRWLVWEVQRDLFSTDTTITLKKAQKPKLEPAPEVTSLARNEGDDSVVVGGKVRDLKKVRDRIVAAAYKGLNQADRLVYRQSRPMPRTLWTGNPLYTDCSGFVTLVYKAAGAPDPNGYDYNGSGYTGSLMNGGIKVSNPKPGDMVFYRSPEHVGIYIGDGEIIEFGGEPGPLKVPVHYRNDLIGYWRFDLSPEVEPDPHLQIPVIKAPTGKHAPYNRP